MVLSHGGSNTFNLALVELVPDEGLGAFAVTNAGGEEVARPAAREALTLLIRQLRAGAAGS